MKEPARNVIIESIAQLHGLLNIGSPLHPLITVIDFENIPQSSVNANVRVILNLYSVSIKRNVSAKLKYGQTHYDYDEGVLGTTSPGQILSSEGDNSGVQGAWLLFHPDFVRGYSLGKRIKEYGFFSYSVNEALILSGKEEKMLLEIFAAIHREYDFSIDKFSQDVIVSQLDLLLNYTNRYYNRQFLTRKSINSDLAARVDDLLTVYFKDSTAEEKGLPTVQFLADEVHLSANYLSDMLKELTGYTALQHIHNHMVETAKENLASTNLSVSEIAYKLGFQHPQSFNKFFKQKTGYSPTDFRHSFN